MAFSCRNCIIHWRYWIGPLAIFLYAIAVLVFVPLFLVKSVQDGFNKRDQEIFIAGIFAWLAVPISLWEIIQHVINYSEPKLQKPIIRILWMVPIYAINAWLVLLFPEQSIYMDSGRECYEAFVIYNFMKFLLNYLNAEMDLETNLELKPQHGILQYTVVRPLSTAISVVCEVSGVYGDGEFVANRAYPYLLAVNNLSQFVAMYCLVLFYKATAAELKPMKPLPKFLCIKAVVFFSFFQGVLIDILVYSGIIFKDENTNEELNVSKRLQNFLICIEMCMAAIAHHYSFSYKQFINTDSPRNCCQAFLAMWDVSDIHHDIQEHIGIVSSSLSRRIRGRSMYNFARGTDEYTNLMAKPSSSVPNDFDLYQNDENDFPIKYGSVKVDTNEK
ncbi:hypothetical protein RI129_007139 [Pyrocoelia pectoralis]|uniref:Transmembrane protein 184C n=1 Tax=Pyrocoelia pectoralis TaxID=417401 RepID=A0AAN7VHF3_9COLE